MSNVFFEKKHVLVVSSEPRVLAEIKMELMGNFEVSIAATGDAAIFVIETYQTAAIILHIDENRKLSFNLYAEISESAKSKKIPVIFLAEKGNDDDETNAFIKGAVDYTVRRRGTVNALNSRINLRIHASENENKAADKEPSDQVSREAPLADKTILIVDDVELNRELVAGMLADVSGLQLDFAVNGQKAVHMFEKEPDRYSLILMDIHMPFMSGIEATMKIRSLDHERAQEIPIIAMTADVEEEATAEYFSSGMNDYVPKPMGYAQLINLVTEYVF